MGEKRFTIRETKTCRKYTRHTYEVIPKIDDSLVEFFSIFGTPKIINIKKHLPNSYNLLKIRSLEFSFELSASLHGHDLTVIYEKQEREIMQMVENEINEWVSSIFP